MVKKLLKHEAIYYLRTLIIFEAVLFGLAIFTRLLLFFETDSVIYYLLQGSSYALFGLAAFACALMTNVICVYRFYKNLFTNEGYLSFTLPVSTNQHLFAKLFSAIVYGMIIDISIVLAFLITISGDILTEVCKAAIYAIDKVLQLLNNVQIIHIVLYIIEFIVILLLSVLFNYLLYYVCITIGQTAKKNRILLAVGCYFAYAAATEIIGTVFSIIYSLTLPLLPMEQIGEFIMNHPYASIHIVMLVVIIPNLILTAAFYMITHRIISRKLNLE